MKQAYDYWQNQPDLSCVFCGGKLWSFVASAPHSRESERTPFERRARQPPFHRFDLLIVWRCFRARSARQPILNVHAFRVPLFGQSSRVRAAPGGFWLLAVKGVHYTNCVVTLPRNPRGLHEASSRWQQRHGVVRVTLAPRWACSRCAASCSRAIPVANTRHTRSVIPLRRPALSATAVRSVSLRGLPSVKLHTALHK